ncbi:MAG TPA: nuclear transport factor 2 family protein [Candidatus Baltobacteraceae bacterium]
MRYATALFLISALATAGVAQAQTAGTVPAATQKTINGLYQLTCAAVQEPTDKNLNAAFAVLAPDYVETDAKGKQHKRDEVVAAGRMQLKMIEADDCTISVDSMTAPDPSTLVIIATQHVTGSVPGQDGKHQLDATSKSSDTWKLENGSWLETQSKNLRALVKVDGNVVDDEGN